MMSWLIDLLWGFDPEDNYYGKAERALKALGGMMAMIFVVVVLSFIWQPLAIVLFLLLIIPFIVLWNSALRNWP